MENKPMLSVEEIKELMCAMKANDMSRLEILSGESTIKLSRKPVVQSNFVSPSDHTYFCEPPVEGVSEQPTPDQATSNASSTVVNSPIVGTFYSSPSPDKPAYVKVGSQVKKGDTLFIIESMKLMNEVASELDGTVVSILVQDGQGVEYGQPILCIE